MDTTPRTEYHTQPHFRNSSDLRPFNILDSSNILFTIYAKLRLLLASVSLSHVYCNPNGKRETALNGSDNACLVDHRHISRYVPSIAFTLWLVFRVFEVGTHCCCEIWRILLLLSLGCPEVITFSLSFFWNDGVSVFCAVTTCQPEGKISWLPRRKRKEKN